MRVLLADENRTARAGMVRCLTERGHRVGVVDGADALLVALSHEPPEALLLDCGFARQVSVLSLLRRIRGGAGGRAIHIVAQLGGLPAREIESLLAAGADDFVRTPCPRDELIVRLEAPLRAGPPRYADPAAGRVLDWTGSDLTAQKHWRDARSVVHAALSNMLGCKLNLSAEAAPVSQPAFAASLPLVGAGDAGNLELAIAVSSSTMRELAMVLTGDDALGRADLEDIVREMSNQAAGAIKRAASEEGISYTLGLPVTCASVGADGRGNEGPTTLASYRLPGSDHRILVQVRATTKDIQTIPASRLCEGMVLVRGLHNTAGALLAPAGTRLTLESAQRIAKMVGSKTLVDVAVAA